MWCLDARVLSMDLVVKDYCASGMGPLGLEWIDGNLAEVWQLFAQSCVMKSSIRHFHDSGRITVTDGKDISMV